MPGLLVFCEQHDGTITPGSLGLLRAARSAPRDSARWSVRMALSGPMQTAVTSVSGPAAPSFKRRASSTAWAS